jgi:tetratricopeptide (TPR) repeat protein
MRIAFCLLAFCVAALSQPVNAQGKEPFPPYPLVGSVPEPFGADPCDAGSYRLRGIALGCKKEWAHAIDDFTESLRLNYYQADVFTLRGIARLKMSPPDFDRAAADFDRALRLDPDMGCAYFWRAIAMELKWSKEATQKKQKELAAAKAIFGIATKALTTMNAVLKSNQAAVDKLQTTADKLKGESAVAMVELARSEVNLLRAKAAVTNAIPDCYYQAVAVLKAVEKNVKAATSMAAEAAKASAKATTDLADANRILTTTKAEATKAQEAANQAQNDVDGLRADLATADRELAEAASDREEASRRLGPTVADCLRDCCDSAETLPKGPRKQ